MEENKIDLGKMELIAVKNFPSWDEMYRIVDFLNKSLKQYHLMFGLKNTWQLRSTRSNMKIGHFFKEAVTTIIIAVVITVVLKLYILDNRIIPSSSMYPTIFIGDMVLVNKLVYHFYAPERGDIIVFKPTAEVSKDDLIKRVIGLPGDVVEVKNNRVYINGNPLKEPYLNESPQYTFGPVTVPQDHLLVLGDNRNLSFDSHRWPDPFLEISAVKGKAFFRYWPLKRAGKLNF